MTNVLGLIDYGGTINRIVMFYYGVTVALCRVSLLCFVCVVVRCYALRKCLSISFIVTFFPYMSIVMR